MKKLVVLFLALCGFAHGQGGLRSGVAHKQDGAPAPNAMVRICRENATGVPCAPLITISGLPKVYTERTLNPSLAKANPFPVDYLGNFSYALPPGYYKEQIIIGTSVFTQIIEMPTVSGNGSVGSVFGRTGAVFAETGDYTVDQITGAAPIASPTFMGVVSLPITGTTQCLHTDASGVITGTGSDCGSGGGGGGTGNVSTTPGAAQTIVQPLASNVQTQFSVNSLNNVTHAQQYNWTRSPSSPSTLTGGSPMTVTLATCPAGIDVSGSWNYNVYVAQGGGAEPVIVTGGTCAPGAASGTIVFTPVASYSAGYTVASASGGAQEACNTAGFVNSTSTPNSTCVIDPTGANANPLRVYGVNDGITIHYSRQKLIADGAVLKCATRGACIMNGTEAAAGTVAGNEFVNLRFQAATSHTGYAISNFALTSNVATITTSTTTDLTTNDKVIIKGLQISGAPTCIGISKVLSVPTNTTFTVACTHANVGSTANVWGAVNIENAAFEDSTSFSKIDHPRWQSGATTSPTGKFNEGFVIDDDEALTMVHPDTESNGAAALCDTTWCADFIYSPLAVNNGVSAGVMTIIGGNISLACGGNGILWDSGNTYKAYGTVIQSYNQFATRSRASFASNPGFLWSGVYTEVGGCTNPLGYGIAGTITNGGQNNISGTVGPTASTKQFANTGATKVGVYIVGTDSTYGTTNALPIGFIKVNSGDSPTVAWPEFGTPGNTTYTLVLGAIADAVGYYNAPTTASCAGGAFPTCGVVASGLVPGTVCTAGKCTYNWTVGTTTAYTYADGYFPYLDFWPDATVTGSPTGADSNNSATFLPSYIFDSYAGQAFTTAGSSTSVIGTKGMSITAQQCVATNPSTVMLISCQAYNPVANAGAAPTQGVITSIHANSGGPYTGFQTFVDRNGAVNIIGTEALTLRTKNTQAILGAHGFQTTADATDTWIGFDQSSAVAAASNQLAFGAPISISNYLGTLGDNTNWYERLTTALKSFKVPVTSTGLGTFAGLASSLQADFSAGAYVFSGVEVSAPSSPSAGKEKCYLVAGSGLQCKNSAGSVFTMQSSGSGSFNQTIQNSGSSLAQEPTLNFTGAGITCVDNGGSTRTDCNVPGGGGSVTTFSAGTLSPLFTTAVATATTTPALTFALTNAGGGTVFGRSAGSSGAPSYTTSPILGIPGTSTGQQGFAGSGSGTATVTAQATAGSPTLTLPNASGTFAVSASLPLVLSATTGALTAPTAVSAAGLSNNRLSKASGAQSLVDSCMSDDGVTLTNNCSGGFVVGTGAPFLATQTASNTDLAGTGTMTAGTFTYSFAKTWLTAPICVATDTAAAAAVRVQTSTTTLTVTGTSGDTMNYICVGRT